MIRFEVGAFDSIESVFGDHGSRELIVRSFTSFRMTHKKSHARKTHGFELLAPFGGITRIRFKGSSEFRRTSQPLAPPLFDFRIGPTRRKSINTLLQRNW